MGRRLHFSSIIFFGAMALKREGRKSWGLLGMRRLSASTAARDCHNARPSPIPHFLPFLPLPNTPNVYALGTHTTGGNRTFFLPFSCTMSVLSLQRRLRRFPFPYPLPDSISSTFFLPGASAKGTHTRGLLSNIKRAKRKINKYCQLKDIVPFLD